MIVTIRPSQLAGTILAPASKSSMQRACATAVVRRGISILKNPGHSHDDKAALQVIRALGAQVESLDNGTLHIRSEGIRPGASAISTGESGLGIRMFAPIAAMGSDWMTLEGEGSLLTRPLDFFDEVFPQLGVEISSNKGRLPIRLKGPLRPASIRIDGSLSSQFLTGLLLAYSASGASDVTIEVSNLKSKPYIDLTLRVMTAFGLPTPQNDQYERFYFPKVQTPPTGEVRVEYTVEGDWSGGAFLLVAGAIAGPITVQGLDTASVQGDKEILQALMRAGARLSIRDAEIEVSPLPLKGFDFDATDCPDLFPPLVALASYCEGKSTLHGVSRLAHKESNRGLTLQEEFGKMGIRIDLQDDLMVVQGGKPQGASVSSRSDHRIAMACAVAALHAEGETTIEKAQAINKSYPDFFRDLKSLKADATVYEEV